MNKFDRIFQMHQMFSSHRYPIKISQLAIELDCSKKTVKRALDYYRDHLYAPLEYLPDQKAWRYQPDSPQFELPGLWMTESELVSLMLLLSILETFGDSLLSEEIKHLNNYINQLIEKRGLNREQIAQRVKIIPITQKSLATKILYQISEATFKRKKLHIDYENFHGEKSQRTISPQTLVYFRDNWYIDAWCNLRNDLRTFSIARIKQAEISKQNAKDIPQKQLKEFFSSSYGIFSGQPLHTAKLKFSPRIAKEIAMQCWHEKQQTSWQADHYILEIPYRRSEELEMDIMRYLPDVEVIAPEELKTAIKDKIEKAYRAFC